MQNISLARLESLLIKAFRVFTVKSKDNIACNPYQ